MDRGLNVEDLVHRLSNLGRKSHKKIPASSLPNVDKSIIHRSLVFKVITDLEVRRGTIHEALTAAWQLKEPIDIREYGEGIFLATFANERDARKILSTGPWFFRRDPISMQRCILEKAASQYSFSNVELWIQIKGIPLEYMNAKCITSIVSSFGAVCGDLEDSLQKWGSYVRVKVSLSISNGLVSFIDFPVQTNNEYKLYIQYEKLGRFCKFCGCICHDKKSCDLLEELEICLCSQEVSPTESELLKKLREDRLSDDVRAISPNRRRPQFKVDNSYEKSKIKITKKSSSSPHETGPRHHPQSDTQSKHFVDNRSPRPKNTKENFSLDLISSPLQTRISPELLHIIAPKTLTTDPSYLDSFSSPISRGDSQENRDPKPVIDCSPSSAANDVTKVAMNQENSMEGFNPGFGTPKNPTISRRKPIRRKKVSHHSNKYIVRSPSTQTSKKRSLANVYFNSPNHKLKHLRKAVDLVAGGEPSKVRRGLPIGGMVDSSDDHVDGIYSSAEVAVQPRRTL